MEERHRMNFFETTAFPWVVGEEGVLSLDPRDRGNWTGGHEGVGVLKGTKYGVSAAAYPDLDIANLTLQQAHDIARFKYWTPAGCDQLPQGVALCVFDFAYNAGVHESVMVLQRALSVPRDGVFGPHTLAAVQSEDPRIVVSKFTDRRIEAYRQMPQWDIDGAGWRNRALAAREMGIAVS